VRLTNVSFSPEKSRSILYITERHLKSKKLCTL